MNKHNAKDYLPFVQALAEGKTIEVAGAAGWQEVVNAEFARPASEYRIKPEPKLRPWTRDEAPMLAEYKSNYGVRALAIRVTDRGIVFAVDGGIGSVQDFREVLNDWTYSADGGKTWKLCGVVE